MTLKKEKQQVSADQILQAIADGSEIELNSCIITGDLDINRLLDDEQDFQTDKLIVTELDDKKTVTVPQKITFNDCTFQANVFFSPPWSQVESLAVFFAEDVAFNSSTFLGQTRFRNAEFCKAASFDGCTFEGIVSFRCTQFHGKAFFRTVVFNRYCLLTEAVFSDEALFASTKFSKGANFANAVFGDSTDFAGAYSASKSVPVYESIKFSKHRFGEDETFWRFIKQSAAEAGYYQLAGECFYNERCSHLWRKFRGPNYQSCTPFQKFTRFLTGVRLLPELLFGRMLFGYGERPSRVLIASAVLIVLCALFYSSGAAHLIYQGAETKQSFLQGLYFSSTTFATLGVGDLHPRPDSITRYVVMAEALAGGLLMASFVVCLAKRFSRG